MSKHTQFIPILVGCGQFTDRSTDGHGLRPIEMMAKASRAAAADTECLKILDSVDHLAATGLTVDAEQAKTPISGAFTNVPQSVANCLGVQPSKTFYAATGGNTPQYLVNHFAEKIAEGSAETVLLTGGESLATMLAKFDRLYKWLLPKGDWRDDPGGQAIPLGDTRPSNNAYEGRHGLDLPAQVYPLFENALQAHYGRSAQEQRNSIGQIFSEFTKIAERNPFAWFRQARSPEQLIEANPNNRMVAYPYTKHLNSMIGVNQSAAIIMTSVEKARALGIPQSRWVYLHGCADANDIWHVSERRDFVSSPAMRRCAEVALSMAGSTIDEIKHFDIYSCFPSAVQIACDEFGIAHTDQRGLSLTGGLPYFGGPGNNYSMHAIAEMMNRLRENPGDFGLTNANGWFLTKHSLGIYSTQPLKHAWRRADSASYQNEILKVSGPELTSTPSAKGRIETFTVLYNRKQQPVRGIVVGRDEANRRFLANTPKDADMMSALIGDDTIGRVGRIKTLKGRNIFHLE